ncbi:MAG: hemerythrin domain-containing protein [Prevotellaceae bacterium]|jgi:regulator of cell morphogenesis and NO signaling|nr:hemerythrin domain-containing protein [Prevotellaceae bacterium]
MNYGLFSERMKLADLVLTNYRLLYVMPCFDIGLGFGEATVKQACEAKGISTHLFLLVCNIYTFDDYRPEPETLTQIRLADLMKYLTNSHKDYLENRMPKIITQILDLIDENDVPHGKMIIAFCEKYRKEVVAHFAYEEQTVFPYIESLLGGGKSKSYKIKEYKGNHSDLDSSLSDLKNIIIKYLPCEHLADQRRETLISLFLFELDLSKHTLLEDKILIYLVEQMENKLNE